VSPDIACLFFRPSGAFYPLGGQTVFLEGAERGTWLVLQAKWGVLPFGRTICFLGGAGTRDLKTPPPPHSWGGGGTACPITCGGLTLVSHLMSLWDSFSFPGLFSFFSLGPKAFLSLSPYRVQSGALERALGGVGEGEAK
jgi:hypothetical protein